MLVSASTGRSFVDTVSNPTSKYRRKVKEYVEASGLNARTVRDMCDTGELKAKKKGRGRLWYIHDEEFDKILNE